MPWLAEVRVGCSAVSSLERVPATTAPATSRPRTAIVEPIAAVRRLGTMSLSSRWNGGLPSRPRPSSHSLRRHAETALGAGSGSDPAAALEDQIEHEADEHHERDRHRVSETPAELGHVLEVHAVDRADQRRSEQDRRPGGDLLHLLVLVDRHLVEGLRLEREMHAEDVLEEHAEAVDPFLDAFGVILYVAEVPALLLVDAGEVDQLAEDARERFRRALELDHLACQLIRAPR